MNLKEVHGKNQTVLIKTRLVQFFFSQKSSHKTIKKGNSKNEEKIVYKGYIW